MICLRCTTCGHALEISEAEASSSVACPRCGKTLAVRPSTTDTAAIMGPATSIDTRSGEAAAAWFAFRFPPQGPDELGRLGHYRVFKLLGEGGMGMVFEAEDLQLQRRVALKIMRPETAADAAARERFVREARAMASIRSDHIVTIHEVSEAQGTPFLTMEFLQGRPLSELLEQGRRGSAAQVLDLGLQLARGLEAAHLSGLIHRDIKPANIWVEEGSGRVKILDFGLARPTQEDTRLTQTGQIMGTPAYMPPEQADGQRVDARGDLFSLGCVLYEFAAGDKPFNGASTIAILKAIALNEPRSLQDHNPEIPPELAGVVMRLLAKKPQQRPASATQLLEDLRALEGAPAPPSRGSLSGPLASRPRGPQSKKRLAVFIGAGAILVLLAFMAALFALPLFRGQQGDNSSSSKQRPRTGTVPGVTDDEILLGMSAPFSGTSQELGREMKTGIDTYFSHVNDEGGVAGRKLKLVALDDGYEPDRALANMKELHDQRKVFAIIGNVGTPTAEKTVPFAVENHMLFVGPFTGAGLLRKDPPDRYVFNYRASYEEETAAMLSYLTAVKKVRPEQVAVFAQQDGYGDAGFRGVVKMVRKLGGDTDKIVRVGHKRNSDDVTLAVQEILRHDELRAVVMVSTYRPAAAFIKQIKDANRDLIFANVSFVGSNPLAEELRQRGEQYAQGVIVTQVVPHTDSESAAVARYRELLHKYYPNERASFVSLEGYLVAALFVEALRRTGEDLDTDKLREALESIHDLDLGIGTKLNYSPSEHQASHKVWGTILDKAAQYQVLELD